MSLGSPTQPGPRTAPDSTGRTDARSGLPPHLRSQAELLRLRPVRQGLKPSLLFAGPSGRRSELSARATAVLADRTGEKRPRGPGLLMTNRSRNEPTSRGVALRAAWRSPRSSRAVFITAMKQTCSFHRASRLVCPWGLATRLLPSSRLYSPLHTASRSPRAFISFVFVLFC